MQRVIASRKLSTTDATNSTAAPSAKPAARPAAALTLAEQRERAEVRLEKDKARAQALQAKLREDEARIATLKRLEAERGGDASAVGALKALPPTAAVSIFPE